MGERVQISANRKVLMIVINFIANFGESNYYSTCSLSGKSNYYSTFSKDCGKEYVIYLLQ